MTADTLEEVGSRRMEPRRSHRIRHGDAIKRIRHAALSSPGVTDLATRQAAYEGRQLAPPLGTYLQKVREDAPSITDEDLVELRRAGRSEDAILELTIAAAVGAAGRMYDEAMRALRGQT